MTYHPDPIDHYADIIDSRDVIQRIEDLEHDGIEAYEESLGVQPDDGPELDETFDAAAYLDEEDAEELRLLRKLAREGESFPDWQYGATLIRDSHFEDYARELADDIGAVPSDAGWPAYCIDWERAARDLQMDYGTVDFDGVTYWIR